MARGDPSENVTLFTGTSGIDVDSVLERLCDEVGGAASLKFGDHLQRLSGEHRLETLGSSSGQYRELKESFGETISDLVDGGSLARLSDEHEHVFLAMHATYLSQWDDGIFSPVDLGRLCDSLAGRVSRVVVVVDDTFDVYRRLMEPSQKYHTVTSDDKDSREALVGSLDNIVELLRWRDAEVSRSLDMAHTLDVPLYVVAVKHPVWMISRLLTDPLDDLRLYYLSHHISAVRSSWDGSGNTDFHDQLNELVRTALREEDVVLFVPDTIDEYRLETDADGRYVPSLETRWPLPFQQSQYLAPRPPPDVDPLNPKGYEGDEDERGYISGKLEMLLEEIKRQIKVRDHLLVRQSRDGIVSHRPLWQGEVSTGMNKEMEYNLVRRTDNEERRRTNWVIHKRSDLGKRRIARLVNWLNSNIVVEDDVEDDLERLKRRWMADESKVSTFAGEDWDVGAVRAELEGVDGLDIGTNYTFRLPSERYGESAGFDWGGDDLYEEHQRRREGWQQAYEWATTDDLVTTDNEPLFDEEFVFERRLTEVGDDVLAAL